MFNSIVIFPNVDFIFPSLQLMRALEVTRNGRSNMINIPFWGHHNSISSTAKSIENINVRT